MIMVAVAVVRGFRCGRACSVVGLFRFEGIEGGIRTRDEFWTGTRNA
jgi:hypothetical protein